MWVTVHGLAVLESGSALALAGTDSAALLAVLLDAEERSRRAGT
jgi:hypothetical protein